MATHKGGCFCGAVQVEATGEPAVMCYCHCESCRSWGAAPVTAVALWPADAVKVTSGAENLGMFEKRAGTQRQFCKKCGGHVLTSIPAVGMVDLYPFIVPPTNFAPTMHINYGETVLPMRDGLPKFKDFPAEFGGSGDLIPE